MFLKRLWALAVALSASCQLAAGQGVEVEDFLGNTVVLEQPAQRIISLAPHVTENLFSAGVGDKVVAVVDYSNFPAQARSLPTVGGYTSFSIEAIAALNPDLVVAWASSHGGVSAATEQIKALGIPVYIDEPRRLEDVAETIIDLGILGGNEPEARRVASAFMERLTSMRGQYRQAQKLSVLYQVWNEPLQTLNGEHIISDVIRLCGGENAFDDAVSLAPKISIEAVLLRDPEVIVASGMGESRPEWLDDWRRWQGLQAVQKGHLYHVHPDIMQRHTVRLLDGAAEMCERLDRAR